MPLSFKQVLDDIFGPTPKTLKDIPHNEQNEDVFNSGNSTDQEHYEDDSVNADGLDPFYGTHTQTIEEVTGREAEHAHKHFTRGMAALADKPFLSTRELPSTSWFPRTVYIPDANAVILAPRDTTRLRVTVVNSSNATVWLYREEPSSSITNPIDGIPLAAGASIPLKTSDQVWVNSGGTVPAAPLAVGVFQEF